MTASVACAVGVAVTVGVAAFAQSAPQAPPAAPPTWAVVGAAAEVQVDGAVATPDGRVPRRLVLQGPRAWVAPPWSLTGECTIGFAADALGKPESLRVDLPPGAVGVDVAVEAAGPAPLRAVPPEGERWSQPPGPASVRVTGDPAERDYRIEATWAVAAAPEPAAGAGSELGLIARWTGPDDHYAFVCEARGECRLERRMGGHTMKLAGVPAPGGGTPQRLAFEVNGFRLRGFVGDVVMVEALDGALTSGSFGWCWKNGRPPLTAMTVGPPAPPRQSVALVREQRSRATLHVAGPLPHGHWAALELRLDRPGPLLPLTDSGLEPWLLHAPVRPFVLGVPALQRLGPALTATPARGQLACPLAWPDLPALRGQVALARFRFVAADGSVVAAATPPVPLRL